MARVTPCATLATMSATGHSVLVVPVPALEPYIRARWEHYEPSWVSTDPAFTHAHITALAPFLPTPTDDDLATVAAIAADSEPFDFTLDAVTRFCGGSLNLVPDPAGPFAALTSRLWAAFPQCPPYEGRFADVVPHLTLDQESGAITAETVRTDLGDLVPVTTRADRLELHWYAAGDCRVLEVWKLGH